MGDHPEEHRRELESWRDAWLASVGAKNEVGPAERRYGGLSLEDYARFSAHRDRILAAHGQRVGTADGLLGVVSSVASLAIDPPPELVELAEQWNVPLRHPATGAVYPYIVEWQEAMNASPQLAQRFAELQRTFALESMGVTAEEKAALDNILDGKMDMHQRMAQAQAAQREIAEGDAGDPDPLVFPGQPVERLSDYVKMLKGMQGGNMNGVLAEFGLDMMSYGSVCQAWGAKLAADPVLTEKFSQMMAS